ncbi:MAG: cysteine--tRNA ligase, partial [Fimbriimonadales bacterium]
PSHPNTPGELEALLNALEWMMETVLGVPLQSDTGTQSEVLDRLMACVIAWRQELRQRKLYDLADRVRDDLKALGIVLEDSPQGTTWRMG